jgi:hypothetical protein
MANERGAFERDLRDALMRAGERHTEADRQGSGRTTRFRAPLIAFGSSVALVIVLVVGVMAWNTSSSDGTDAPSNVLATPPARVDDQAPASPLSAFANGPQWTPEAATAFEESIAECMRARGWDYAPNTEALPEWQPVTVAEVREFRAEHGYSARTDAVEVGDDLSVGADAELSPEEHARFVRDLDAGSGYENEPAGTPHTGCRTLQWDAWNAQMPILNPATQELIKSANERLLADPDVQRARANWSACMADAGYPDLLGPGQARTLAANGGSLDDEQTSPAPQELEAFEVAIATTDFACQEQHLIPLLQRIEPPIVDEIRRTLTGD